MVPVLQDVASTQSFLQALVKLTPPGGVDHFSASRAGDPTLRQLLPVEEVEWIVQHFGKVLMSLTASKAVRAKVMQQENLPPARQSTPRP